MRMRMMMRNSLRPTKMETNLRHASRVWVTVRSLSTLCPINLNALSCGLKFHNITLLSPDPDASCFNDGLNATDVM